MSAHDDGLEAAYAAPAATIGVQCGITAADRKVGLSLAEVIDLVERCLAAGMDPTASVVKARVGFRGQVQGVEVVGVQR